MRLTFRLIASLFAAATLVAAGSTWLQTREQRARLTADGDQRAALLGDAVGLAAAESLARRDAAALREALARFERRDGLLGISLHADAGPPVAATPGLTVPPGALEAVVRALADGEPAAGGEPGARWAVVPVRDGGRPHGAALVVHDDSRVDLRVSETWRRNFWRLLVHTLLIAAVTFWLIRWNILLPMGQMADWLRSVRSGETAPPPSPEAQALFPPLAREVSRLGESLAAAKAVAEEEARLRVSAAALWTPERLKEHVRAINGGRPIFVVANREPYVHVRRGRRTEAVTPASGLVTGIEPILLACDGTWVAHGSGDADRETVDDRDRLRVPPESPRYTLRRVWLSKEEEEGYYYGFSNEGLWPLCHIAHARPSFRPEDWERYRSVNAKFAEALLEEVADVPDPCVLVQDYHYALLPRLIKEARPDARICLFWHIPWPNPEAFAICPWRKEILDGMLGADLLGFHIQFHCNNFLDTVDRALEARVDRERFAVERGGHSTLVKPFPISVAPAAEDAPAPDRDALLKELGVKADFLAVGVDRVDYTKGIVERFRALERLFEQHPRYRERLTFVQLAAPSRTHIKRYHDLNVELDAEAERINWRFATRDWKPIVLLRRHHGREEVAAFYRAADLCLVTSLHDGMNLVAKEYVASRRSDDGMLVLSGFTGAARELADALIVNPYDAVETSEAIRAALEMSPEERSRRMAAMRRVVRENNVFRWAGRLTAELARIRTPEPADARVVV